jgi:chemotaxis protein MotB
MAKKKRKTEHEQDNSDRWLLTYADLITLLLGLFVILYAMSKVDSEKYAEIVSALGGVFGVSKPGVMQGNVGAIEPVMPALQAEKKKIEEQIRAVLGKDIGNESVAISQDERGVTVHLMEKLLFQSGKAELKQISLSTLDRLADALRKLLNDFRVEGHTDDVPINTPLYPSNWHLSVARAIAAGYYLIEKHHLSADRVSIIGYSEYRPLVLNTSAENRSRNRRVDIVILTTPIKAQNSSLLNGNNKKTSVTKGG